MAYLRISRARFDPRRSEEVVSLLREAKSLIWPKQALSPGFIKGNVGVDAETGAMSWITFWSAAGLGAALGSMPEMVESGRRFRAAGSTFEPITTHELFHETSAWFQVPYGVENTTHA
jgi:hypothetical protein